MKIKVSDLKDEKLAEHDKYAPQREAMTTHGMKYSSTYQSWEKMKQRCLNPNHHVFRNYGGRGIKVCDKWLSFEGFYEDMGDRPEGKTLDRINPDGDYTKENCRWATQKEQCRNKRNNTLITLNGVTKCLSEWEEETGIGRQTIKWRLDNGWSIERALT